MPRPPAKLQPMDALKEQESTSFSRRREVLVIGAQFSGLFVARELNADFDVTVVDAKEFFEYTPGILRAYVKPSHHSSLTFLLQPVLEKRLGVRFVHGEVATLEGKAAHVRMAAGGGMETIGFDYCVICSGCNFGPFQKWGESLWSATVLNDARRDSEWPDLDERSLEGRKQHILREHASIKNLNERKAKVLVVGAGFIGVEWVTELRYFFPDLDLTIIDFLPHCLGPLPLSAAKYCSKYMAARGIKEHYCVKFMPGNDLFWKQISMPEKAERTYVCLGVKACNYFMPAATLSDKGPGGGGWIHFNQKLQVTRKPLHGQAVGDLFFGGRVFAVGDCNHGCIGTPGSWVLPPIPKICYPAEEQAYLACRNLRLLDKKLEGGSSTEELKDTWWPWGAGIFATSLGARDGCFVVGNSTAKGSGRVVVWGWLALLLKDGIEAAKMSECRDEVLGRLLWRYVHRMPLNLWGQGPLFP